PSWACHSASASTTKPRPALPLPERQRPLSPWLDVPVAADLLVDPDVIDQHLGGEDRGLVRRAEESATDGHVHEQVERAVEWGGPRVEVGFLRRLESPSPLGPAGAPPERLCRVLMAVDGPAKLARLPLQREDVEVGDGAAVRQEVILADV